jgi:hypothetical protein
MLDETDRAQLAELGISEPEVARQLRLFANPPRPAALVRPCTVGDGIDRLDAETRPRAQHAYDAAARAGRLLKFVPASGAATRMFQSLVAVRQRPGEITRAGLEARAADGDGDSREVLTFIDGRSRFPFVDALAEAIARRGENLDELARRGIIGPVLAALLDPDGLAFAALPKALLPFHRHPGGSRTAFEEHVLEGAAYARSAAGTVRLHFTVSPEHDAACRTLLEALRPRCEARADVRLDVGFSHQQRATDTLAVDLDDQPLRDADGRLVLRPGGHGALIENINDLRGDVVFLKTVDNIQPEHRRGPTLEWMRLLTGHLVALQDALVGHLAALSGGAPSQVQIAAAQRFARAAFGEDVSSPDAAALVEALDRPLRVCGMVRNTGEPGGGPFWVRGPDGRTRRQIVESAQIDLDDGAQRALFEASTHFNPVLIACAVRDWRGRPFDLHRFIDESAVFIACKSKDGQELKALERPGLWNGGMAAWHTVFVEVPIETFTPVKSVNDLLRPEHQPPDEAAIGG